MSSIRVDQTAGNRSNYLVILASPSASTLPGEYLLSSLAMYQRDHGNLIFKAPISHATYYLDLNCSSDGKFAFARDGNSIVRWDLKNATFTFPFSFHSGDNDRTTLDIDLGPSGKLLATSSVDGLIRLWDTSTGELVVTLKGHQAGVNSISFSPDGKTLASVASDGTTRFWDIGQFSSSDPDAARATSIAAVLPTFREFKLDNGAIVKVVFDREATELEVESSLAEALRTIRESNETAGKHMDSPDAESEPQIAEVTPTRDTVPAGEPNIPASEPARKNAVGEVTAAEDMGEADPTLARLEKQLDNHERMHRLFGSSEHGGTIDATEQISKLRAEIARLKGQASSTGKHAAEPNRDDSIVESIHEIEAVSHDSRPTNAPVLSTESVTDRLAASTGKFRMLDLGTLGGDNSEARGVNMKGHVVGFSETAKGIKRAFIWEDGSMTEIPADEALDINDDGVVVGSIKQGRNIMGRPETKAFRWTAETGVETDLLPQVNVGLSPKDLTGHARAVNGRGDIAMIGQGIAMYAIVRDPSGECTDIGHLGGMVSLAYDINDSGDVVGYSKIDRRTVHAFLYRNGSLLDIGSLGLESGAHGINNHGEIVGSSKNRLANFRAFHWQNGEMKDLGTLGGESAHARGINDNSWIVGNSQTSRGEQHAFVYRDGNMSDLNDLIDTADGWIITDAHRISNRNQIAAVASRNGLKHAVLLSPVELKFVEGIDQGLDSLPKTGSRQPNKLHSAGPDIDFHASKSNLVNLELRTTLTSAGKAPPGFKVVDAFATASPDFRRVAFTAERDDERRRLAVIDGEVHPEYLIVNDVKFSPDSKRVAYFAQKSGREGKLLYLDGQLSPVSGITKDLQFTPDSKHLLYVSSSNPTMRNDGRSQWMEAPGGIVWDGVAREKYGMMGKIRVGNDSQTVAFTAVNNGRPVVVVGGDTIGTYSELPQFPFSPPPLLSPDGKRSAFTAKRSGGWFTVVDGRESRQTFESIQRLSFSPDSQRLGFGAKSGSSFRIYIDDSAVGPRLNKVLDRVTFSPDSLRYAVPVTVQEGASVMVDGDLQGTYQVVGRPVFSSNSMHCAFWAEEDGTGFVVCDGRRGKSFDESGATPVFSPDSTKLAYTAKVGEKWVLIVNQDQVDTADEIDSSSLEFGPDSSAIAYWAKRGDEWQMCINGAASEAQFSTVIPARPQAIDFENFSRPVIRFESADRVRGVGKSESGEFNKVVIQLLPSASDSHAAAPPSPKSDTTVEYAVLTRDAALKDGNKTIGKAPKGERFRIEQRQGNWLLGTFTIDGEPKRCWVSVDDVTEE